MSKPRVVKKSFLSYQEWTTSHSQSAVLQTVPGSSLMKSKGNEQRIIYFLKAEVPLCYTWNLSWHVDFWPRASWEKTLYGDLFPGYKPFVSESSDCGNLAEYCVKAEDLAAPAHTLTNKKNQDHPCSGVHPGKLDPFGGRMIAKGISALVALTSASL